MEEYFKHNANDDIDPMTVWEAHKCVIRGMLIAKASVVKKRQATLNDLIARVGRLELAHKSSLAATALQALVEARSQLLDFLDKRQKRSHMLSQNLFYEHSNKNSRLLP